MGDFMPTPYRGVPGVPHAPEELFQVYFIGAQVGFAMQAIYMFLVMVVCRGVPGGMRENISSR